MTMRLNRYIAATGYCSRRKADDLIKTGQVFINGKPVTELSTQVDAAQHQVKVRGIVISISTLRYYKYFKARGDLCSRRSQSDTLLTVFHKLRRAGLDTAGLQLVGRLDKDSEGLILLTNDGDLHQKLSHPKYDIEKTYHLTVRGQVAEPGLRKAKQGVKTSEGDILKLDRVRVKKQSDNSAVVECTLHEGHKRHLRRLFGALGHYVISLKRTRIATIGLGKMEPEEYLALSGPELTALKSPQLLTHQPSSGRGSPRHNRTRPSTARPPRTRHAKPRR